MKTASIFFLMFGLLLIVGFFLAPKEYGRTGASHPGGEQALSQKSCIGFPFVRLDPDTEGCIDDCNYIHFCAGIIK